MRMWVQGNEIENADSTIETDQHPWLSATASFTNAAECRVRPSQGAAIMRLTNCCPDRRCSRSSVGERALRALIVNVTHLSVCGFRTSEQSVSRSMGIPPEPTQDMN
jgi:hypothetical protein